jgi:hypothetical protein
MEDFGYKKDETKNKFSDVGKKTFLIAATLFSIGCFIYITVSAYYFVYQDKNSDIEVIKAEAGPIKVVEEKAENGGSAMQIDRTIYEDIFGNKAAKKDGTNLKIRTAPSPALPPKMLEIDRRLIKDLVDTNEEKPAIIEEKTAANSFDKTKKENAPKNLSETQTSEESATPKNKTKKRLIRVQIAAMTSKLSANQSWESTSRLHSQLFNGLKPFIEEANLGKRGIFYRLQIGNFFNQVEAEEFCEKYVLQTKKSRGDCIVVE